MKRYACSDRMCGDPCCRTCFPATYERTMAEYAHDSHEDPTLPMDECPECLSDREAPSREAEARYDQMREDS